MEKDSLVHLTCYDPSDLWSLIFIRIIPKEHTLKNITKMKKWSSQWTQFMQLRKEAWKKFRTSMGFEPVTSRYQCDALPTELWSHWRWEQANCLFVRCLTLDVWYQKSDVRCLISEVWCQPSIVRRLMSGLWYQTPYFKCLISDVCC